MLLFYSVSLFSCFLLRACPVTSTSFAHRSLLLLENLAETPVFGAASQAAATGLPFVLLHSTGLVVLPGVSFPPCVCPGPQARDQRSSCPSPSVSTCTDEVSELQSELKRGPGKPQRRMTQAAGRSWEMAVFPQAACPFLSEEVLGNQDYTNRSVKPHCGLVVTEIFQQPLSVCRLVFHF